jgi:dTDP-4-amino-4,6-dideoxygalactose transaminase
MKDGKILWSGEGGFILTNDDDLAAKCRAYRTHWQAAPAGQLAYAQLGHNYRLAEPLAVLARANLANFDALARRRHWQTRHLVSLLDDTPGLTPPHLREEESWNGYSALLTIDLDDPRGFCRHLAARGVPNSVGSFGLIGCERRPPFAAYQPVPCPQANTVIDRTLAVVFTEHDSDQRIETYAHIIDEEARRWSRDDV